MTVPVGVVFAAVLSEEFLHATSSQLTVHGLFALGSAMQDEEVAVLFRNNHFSTIYKHKVGFLYHLYAKGKASLPSISTR